MRNFRVGISACFDPETVHTQTLMRTLVAAISWLPNISALSFAFGNDKASGEGGAQVAREFVAGFIDIILGPFGSDTLLGAFAIYADAGVPLVVATATIDVEGPRNNLFRICPGDQLLASQIAVRVEGRGFRHVAVLSDGSSHYLRLKHMIVDTLGDRASIGEEDLTSADAIVYTGRLEPSNSWLNSFRGSGRQTPVLMTDDAAATGLLEGVSTAGDLEVFGFPVARQVPGATQLAARYRRRHAGDPPIYFLEIFAALEVISQVQQSAGNILEALSSGTFDTVFGATRFVGGERNGAALAIWKANSDGVLQSHSIVACRTTSPPLRNLPPAGQGPGLLEKSGDGGGR